MNIYTIITLRNGQFELTRDHGPEHGIEIVDTFDNKGDALQVQSVLEMHEMNGETLYDHAYADVVKRD
jgi:hypothetical protein